MMQFAYISALLVSLAGLAVLDRRFKLAFWFDAARTSRTLLISIAVFIVWDLLGIGLGIFFHGGSQLTLPIRLLPEFPIEELFFLALLCYCTLLVYRGISRAC